MAQGDAAGTPEVSVVVASHDRPIRLRWLLNALEEQTLPTSRWELIVAHDSYGPETGELLRTHPLAAAGELHEVTLEPGSAPPGRNRNAGWRLARAPLVAFTDDDCRPLPDWLERGLEGARLHPEAVVQGRTRPDPDETGLLVAPHARTQNVAPPHGYAQACNIFYPRELLERLDGFDDEMIAGEDAELACRANSLGAELVGAPEARVYHAVTTPGLLGALRAVSRWRDLPALVGRHPWHRELYPQGVFWKDTHLHLPLALAGAALSRRQRLALLLVLPWVAALAPYYGRGPRKRLRSLTEVPGRAAIAIAEFVVLSRGSLRHRSLFL
jgi:glycosyltransferase involved in cell wall biosynthesis